MNGVWWSRLMGDNWSTIVIIQDASPMEIENFIETIYSVSTTHNQDFASYSETEGFHGFTESEMEAAVEELLEAITIQSQKLVSLTRVQVQPPQANKQAQQ